MCRPETLDEALRLLDGLGPEGMPLAGATWAMRAPHRGETYAGTYVSLHGIAGLRAVSAGAERASLGALATHEQLAALDPRGPFGALARAARVSAVPAIRCVATLGGNLCARGFAQAELPAALLALDAEVELAAAGGTVCLPVDRFLDERPAGIVTRVTLPSSSATRSGYARLTVRGGGEYPVCGVAVSLQLQGGSIRSARVVAVGLDERARELPAVGAALAGLDPGAGEALVDAARGAAAGLVGRDAPDAPGWYRVAVLPAVVRDAVLDAVGAPA